MILKKTSPPAKIKLNNLARGWCGGIYLTIQEESTEAIKPYTMLDLYSGKTIGDYSKFLLNYYDIKLEGNSIEYKFANKTFINTNKTLDIGDLIRIDSILYMIGIKSNKIILINLKTGKFKFCTSTIEDSLKNIKYQFVVKNSNLLVEYSLT